MNNGIELAPERPFSYKTWFIWSVLCFIFAFTSIPFVMSLQGDSLAKALGDDVTLSLTNLMIINATINGVMCIVLGGLGLLMASRIGLGSPFIEKAVRGEAIKHNFGFYVAISIAAGLAVSAGLIVVDGLIFGQPFTQILDPTGVDLTGKRPPFWQGFIAAFSAGILEETLFRLFGMTLIMWLLQFVVRSEAKHNLFTFMIANIIMAIVFALSHITNLALFEVQPTSAIILRILVLNSILALPFGWLYYRYGLETAVIAHIVTDIIVAGVGTFASNAATGQDALLIYILAHVVLLAIAGAIGYTSKVTQTTAPLSA